MILIEILRGGKNIMVMCETYKYNKEKTETNKRKECAEVMEKAKHHHPWFGEYSFAFYEYLTWFDPPSPRN